MPWDPTDNVSALDRVMASRRTDNIIWDNYNSVHPRINPQDDIQ